MFHILCFIQNKNTPCINICPHIYKFIEVFIYILIHDGHGLVMMYDIHMHLYFLKTITNDGSKYINFNINT